MTKMQGLIYNDNGHDIALATADGSLCLGTFTPLNTDGAEAFKRLVDAANLSAGADLPAFVAELEALQVKATPGKWFVKSSMGINYLGVEWNNAHNKFKLIAPYIFDFGVNDSAYIAAMQNHNPALLALVRQLQGERDQAVGESASLKIEASKYAYECELAKRERDQAEARLHNYMNRSKQ